MQVVATNGLAIPKKFVQPMDVAKGKRTDALGREVTSLQVTVEAQELLRKACQHHRIGLAMGGVASNLITWWAKQPPHIRTAFADGVDAGMEPAYADALERLAERLRASGSAASSSAPVTAADARGLSDDELNAIDRIVNAEKLRREAGKPSKPTGIIANRRAELRE